MHTVQINLNSIDKVKAFVHSVNTFNTEFDLMSGRSVIDAKSIMGIFSLDLSKPISLTIYNDDDAEIMESLKPFLVQ
ncbi:HPr family phosphocarrier protein [Frisingicoccus sp.]|uniref:HPr family phosphocarrier protein n=1 Tax=Frisingicoccus sp. TaxID=1918627 RepID=UPI003AB4E80E